MPEALQAIILTLILLIPLFGLFCMVTGWPQKRLRRNLREAARKLGLKAEGGAPEPASFAGEVEGVPVRLAFSSEWKPLHGGRVIQVNRIAISAALPKPLGLQLEIMRAVFLCPRNMNHPDRDFDRHCAVTTDNQDLALALLDSRPFREQIRRFLAEGKGMAHVRGSEVRTSTCDHWAGPDLAVKLARDAAGLARELSTRGEKRVT